MKLIVELSDKNPKIEFDTSMPDGQPRRACDTTKLKKEIGFEPRFTLREGVKKTIEWYQNNLL